MFNDIIVYQEKGSDQMRTVLKPSVRKGYSDRNNIVKINTDIQVDDLDGRTRNKIINIFNTIFLNFFDNRDRDVKPLIEYMYEEIFDLSIDDIPAYSGYYSEYQVRLDIVENIKNWEINELFDFLEVFCSYLNRNHNIDLFSIFNEIFENECVGFRFVDEQITSIIDKNEIKSIEDAISSKYSAPRKSMKKAMGFLFNREKPDYSNSVKESISAIEGMCNIINGTKTASLGQAIKKLEDNGVVIHGAMKNAYDALYGYTSDKSGIRHNSGIDEKTTFSEAKYMLVSCSAFLNYLVENYEAIE